MEELLKRLKFNIGDTGYFVNWTRVYPKCSSCEGTGKVGVKYEDKDIKVTCPSCKGYGEDEDNAFKEYTVEEEMISAVQISDYIEYASSYDSYSHEWNYESEEDWFKTREEAEIEIKKRSESK